MNSGLDETPWVSAAPTKTLNQAPPWVRKKAVGWRSNQATPWVLACRASAPNRLAIFQPHMLNTGPNNGDVFNRKDTNWKNSKATKMSEYWASIEATDTIITAAIFNEMIKIKNASQSRHSRPYFLRYFQTFINTLSNISHRHRLHIHLRAKP